MAAILQCEHVGLRPHASRELLRDLEFALAPGATLLVVGARGVGKTLLAELAAGLRRPDRGLVRLFGRDVAALAASELATMRRRIGFAPEQPTLLGDLTPAEEVAVPLRLRGVAGSGARRDAAELLRWLGSPAPDARFGPSTPPEERMRIGLARAVIARPELVVLDAPLRTGNGLLAERLAVLVRQMRSAGTAFLLTGADAREADALPDAHVLRLVDGRLRPADGNREPAA